MRRQLILALGYQIVDPDLVTVQWFNRFQSYCSMLLCLPFIVQYKHLPLIGQSEKGAKLPSQSVRMAAAIDLEWSGQCQTFDSRTQKKTPAKLVSFTKMVDLRYLNPAFATVLVRRNTRNCARKILKSDSVGLLTDMNYLAHSHWCLMLDL